VKRETAPRSKKNEQLLVQLQLEATQTARERLGRRLGPQVIQRLGINRFGVELICWLTDRVVRTNEEAVACWIATQLSDDTFIADALHTPEIDLLSQRMLRRLQIAMDSFAC